MKTFNQIREELQERISGSGTDRKAVLKRAFRAGQHATDRFYGDRGREKSRTIPAPKGMRNVGHYTSKHKDKGIQKAFNVGKHSDDSMSPPKGKERSKPQDSLKVGRSKMYKKGKFVGPTDRLGLVHPDDRKKLPG
tara:strand:+ start:40 stop:447 length:408 start_codon:yes stop_codon:yes gene_type:complete